MHPFSSPIKRVLLVEDDRELLEELTDFLKSVEKYEVVPMPNGLEALDYLAKNPRVDIIVSDYLMIGKGSDLARAAISHGIPTVIITGNYEEAVKALKSYSLKIPVLKKPFSPFKLVELIEYYTEGKPASGTPVLAAWWDDLK